MRRFRIESRADVQAIERLPYDEAMPFRSVYEGISASAADYPDRFALTFLRTGEPGFAPLRFTHSEFAAKVRQAANLFRSLGVGADDAVAMLLPSIPQAYFTLFGAETAARACPINFLLGPQHIAELIQASGARVLVTLGPDPELDLTAKIARVRELCPSLQVLTVGEFDAALSLQPEALSFEPVSDRQRTSATFHTGGTTGTPKLARHTHGNQLHASWGAAQMYAMTEKDVIINGFPLFHVAGSFVYGLSALLSGAEIVLPTMLGMRNPALVRNYWKVVEQFGATLLAGVPTVISTLLATPVGNEKIGSLRCMLTGGSPLPTELANQFEARFQIPVRNILGMTESSGVISIVPFLGVRTPGSCGLPLPYTETKIVDGSGAPSETGTLLIRGPNISPGYTDPKRNAGMFTADGFLISGDLGHIGSGGEIHITGRAKDVIIRGAHNIDPAEIEEALMRHEKVLVAAAVGEPDEYAGELPVAFVVLKPGLTAGEAELQEFARLHISERPAWPKRVTLLDALPMTAVGKIYKPQLRAHAIERVIRERMEQQLTAKAKVTCRDLGAKLILLFEHATSAGRESAEREIKAMMGPFAIEYEVSFGESP